MNLLFFFTIIDSFSHVDCIHDTLIILRRKFITNKGTEIKKTDVNLLICCCYKKKEGFNRTCLSTAAARAKSSVAKQSRDNKTAHALARQSPYPHSTQRRHHVPDFLVDWKVDTTEV